MVCNVYISRQKLTNMVRDVEDMYFKQNYTNSILIMIEHILANIINTISDNLLV